MNLQHYFKQGVVDPLGYSPNSSSTKPVHIANGLCRAVLGQFYDPKILNHTLIRWAKSEERHTTEDLIASASEQLGDLAEPRNLSRLNELRQLLKGVLGADDAVYDRNDMCSYTLTHKTHVTRDHNDRLTGNFLYAVLSANLGKGPSPLLKLLTNLLDDASDEISVLSLPLTKGEEPHDHIREYDETPDSLELKNGSSGQIFRSPILRTIRECFDKLAEFESTKGSKLHSLRRIVSFATFSLYLHLTHRGTEYLDLRSYGTNRPLMLLDFIQQGWTPIANASHATYTLATKKIEAMIIEGVRLVLVEELGESPTTRQIECFI